jgi:hypothetical protein
MANDFVNFVKRDAQLESALKSPPWDYGFKGAGLGLVIGAISCACFLGEKGYEFGNDIINYYQIANDITKIFINAGLSTISGLAGTVGGSIIGLFGGFYVGSKIGSIKENNRKKQ